MNIVWLHSHFLNWMGGHKYVFEVSKRLARTHKVTLFTSQISEMAQRQFDRSNVSVKIIGTTSTYNPWYWILLPLFVRKEVALIKPEIDVADVIISSYFPAHLWAARLKKSYIQICYEPLSFFYDTQFLSGYNFPVQLFFRIMKVMYANWDKTALLNADSVLTLSEFNADWINRVYGKKITKVVYEGVDSKFFKPVSTFALRKKYRDKQIIFHSTDFTPTKGTDLLIAALSIVKQSIPNVLLLVSNTIDNTNAKQQIVERIKHSGVEKNVLFLGNLVYNDLPSYYSLADVVVQPSRSQSMSLSVKEAMACKTPVILGLEGREQTLNGEAGFLVNVNKTDQLAHAIISIMNDKKRAELMGKRGRKIIEKKFSWEAVTKKIQTAISNR